MMMITMTTTKKDLGRLIKSTLESTGVLRQCSVQEAMYVSEARKENLQGGHQMKGESNLKITNGIQYRNNIYKENFK